MRFLFLIIALFSLYSCSEKEEKIPDYVWNEDRFVEILTEFQKAESIVRLGYNTMPDSAYAKDSIYKSVFNKMNITEEEFDSNYSYYLKDPEQMEKIYDQVITKISEQAAELEKKK